MRRPRCTASNNDPKEVQVSTLLSIKTGGCPEDCAYCPQAARYHTDIEKNDLMTVEQVRKAAEDAKAGGSSRLCMGAAWRNVKDNDEFDQVLDMVKTVYDLDMEVCCTLGMVTENQAKRLAAAGLYAATTTTSIALRSITRDHFYPRLGRPYGNVG